MQCFPDTQGKFLNNSSKFFENSSKIFSKLKLKPQKLNKPEILVTSIAAKTAKKKPDLNVPQTKKTQAILKGFIFI